MSKTIQERALAASCEILELLVQIRGNNAYQLYAQTHPDKIIAAHFADLEGQAELVAAAESIREAFANNAAPFDPEYALRDLLSRGEMVRLDCGLAIRLLAALAKAKVMP